MKNKYLKRAHISERKFREILKYFTEDLTVSKIARLACLNRNTMINIVQKIRIRIYEFSLLKRGERVYAEVVNDVLAETL